MTFLPLGVQKLSGGTTDMWFLSQTPHPSPGRWEMVETAVGVGREHWVALAGAFDVWSRSQDKGGTAWGCSQEMLGRWGGYHPWAQGRGLVKKAVPGSGRGHVGGEDHLVFPERLKGLLFRFFPYGVVGVTVTNAQEGWNIPPTCQAWSCLRAFAYAVPSAQISTWLAPSQLSTLLAQISPPPRGPP